jgi:HrpA-like RNA helicase
VDDNDEQAFTLAGAGTPASGSISVKDNTKSQAVSSPKNKKQKDTPAQKGGSDSDEDEDEDMPDMKAPASVPAPAEAKPISLAAQMMASLSTLKTDSAVQAGINAKEREEAAERKRLLEAQEKVPVERYVPSNPLVLKTAAALGLKAEAKPETQQRVKQINRPGDVKAVRYHLPVASMEFEVMDGIRNNDVTIICGETGSGT